MSSFTTRRAITATTLQQPILATTRVATDTTALTAAELDVIMRENPLLGIATDPARLVVWRLHALVAA